MQPLLSATAHAFVEYVADLDRVPAGSAIVAATPEVEVACLRDGLQFIALEEGLDPGALEELGAGWFERVERLCARLDEIAGDAPGRQPARWHFFPLKVVHDMVWLHALVFAEWLDRHPLDRVVSFSGGSLPLRVLDCALSARGVPHVRLGEPVVPVVLREPEPHHPRLRLLVRRLRGFRQPQLFALDGGYSLPALTSELRARGCRVGLLRPPRRRWQPRTETWRTVAMDPDVRAMFVWDGIDYWAAAEPVLRVIVEERCASAAAHYDAALEVFRRKQPRALLLSVAAHPEERAVCAAAASLGVPAIVSRHGELGTRYVPMTGFQDLDVVSHALCWGRWEAAWIKRHCARSVETFVVGSPYGESFGRAPSRIAMRSRLGIASDERVVLYVPQLLSGELWYLSRRAPTDLAYTRAQMATLRSLAAQHRFTVLVLEHPTVREASLLERWCRQELPGRVRFLPGPNFGEAYDMPDVVVIDFPSTTMVQALFGRARIVVTEDPISMWEPGVREHLTAHGVLFVAIENLAAELERCELRTEPYPIEAREPLLASGPEPAASRLADAVASISERRG